RTVSVASSHAIPPSPSDFVKELIVLIDITERNPRIVLRFCSVPIEVSHSGLTRDFVPWPEGAIGITRRDSLITQPGNLPIELFVGSDVTQIVSLYVHEVADVTVPANRPNGGFAAVAVRDKHTVAQKVNLTVRVIVSPFVDLV